MPTLPPIRAPRTWDSRKYTPPLSTLHRSQTPIPLRATITTTITVRMMVRMVRLIPALPWKQHNTYGPCSGKSGV
ncbi:hypothetical protein DPMN_158349 [Dreissena polymorpha]|uniref:Uncharacterized protein n=1 Tax=Dreissena polymorpha TaxID=45954 RepID=A0A9D4IPQ0_DREPO|nr:hypothetical protein DPMN_158349 [Dreissena polymorpha]